MTPALLIAVSVTGARARTAARHPGAGGGAAAGVGVAGQAGLTVGRLLGGGGGSPD